MSTYVQYTGDGTTDTFTVTFPYSRPTDLVVYLDGISTSFTIEGSDVVLDPAPAADVVVLIQRWTDITSPIVEFTNSGALYAEHLDDAVDQCRYAIEELSTRIDGVSVPPSGGGGGTSNTPNPTAATQFLASTPDGASFVWSLKTKAQMQTLLEINPAGTTDSRLPSPTSGNKFLITNASTNTYELQTVAQIKTLLAVPTVLLPAINGRASNILVTASDASGYQLTDGPGLRSILALGTAALLNAGTSVGNLVQLVSHASGPALPAVRGDNLLGVAKEMEYAMWEKTSTVTLSSLSYANVSSTMTEVVASPTAWVTLSGGSAGLTLTAGKYRLALEARCLGTNRGVRLHILATDGATTVRDIADIADGEDKMRHLETSITVASGHTVDVVIEGKQLVSTSGSSTVQSQRLHIWKYA